MDVSERLDRDAVRRVLRRATQLSDQQPVALPDIDDRIDADTLVAAAAEVGIPEDAVRRAITIEAFGPPPKSGSLLGPRAVIIDDELHGAAGDVLSAVDRWLVAGHHMRRDRLREADGVWSRRRGLVGSMFRNVRQALGEGYLGDLDRIEAAVRDTGAGTCVVRVVADLSDERRNRGAAGAVVGGAATAGAVVGALALGPWLLLVTPVTAAIGAGIATSGRRRARRVGTEIDRVLDSVEHHDRPGRLGPDLARRALRG